MELIKLKIVKFLLDINIVIGRKLMNFVDNYSLEEEISEVIQKENIDIRKQSSRFRNIWIHDQDIIDKRWLECEKCEHLIKATSQCNLCKCFMKVKTRISTASCPDNPKRWGKEYNFIKGESINGIRASS